MTGFLGGVDEDGEIEQNKIVFTASVVRFVINRSFSTFVHTPFLSVFLSPEWNRSLDSASGPRSRLPARVIATAPVDLVGFLMPEGGLTDPGLEFRSEGRRFSDLVLQQPVLKNPKQHAGMGGFSLKSNASVQVAIDLVTAEARPRVEAKVPETVLGSGEGRKGRGGQQNDDQVAEEENDVDEEEGEKDGEKGRDKKSEEQNRQGITLLMSNTKKTVPKIFDVGQTPKTEIRASGRASVGFAVRGEGGTEGDGGEEGGGPSGHGYASRTPDARRQRLHGHRTGKEKEGSRVTWWEERETGSEGGVRNDDTEGRREERERISRVQHFKERRRARARLFLPMDTLLAKQVDVHHAFDRLPLPGRVSFPFSIPSLSDPSASSGPEPISQSHQSLSLGPSAPTLETAASLLARKAREEGTASVITPGCPNAPKEKQQTTAPKLDLSCYSSVAAPLQARPEQNAPRIRNINLSSMLPPAALHWKAQEAERSAVSLANKVAVSLPPQQQRHVSFGAAADASMTVATGGGLSGGSAGALLEILVTLNDSRGLPVTANDLTVLCVLNPTDPLPSKVVFFDHPRNSGYAWRQPHEFPFEDTDKERGKGDEGAGRRSLPVFFEAQEEERRMDIASTVRVVSGNEWRHVVGGGGNTDFTLVPGVVAETFRLAPHLYCCRYSCSRAGHFKVSVAIGGAHITGSPFPATIWPGPLHYGRSRVTGSGAEKCEASEGRDGFERILNEILVIGYDAFGNRLCRGGEGDDFSLVGTDGVRLEKVEDREDGSYCLFYSFIGAVNSEEVAKVVENGPCMPSEMTRMPEKPCQGSSVEVGVLHKKSHLWNSPLKPALVRVPPRAPGRQTVEALLDVRRETAGKGGEGDGGGKVCSDSLKSKREEGSRGISNETKAMPLLEGVERDIEEIKDRETAEKDLTALAVECVEAIAEAERYREEHRPLLGLLNSELIDADFLGVSTVQEAEQRWEELVKQRAVLQAEEKRTAELEATLVKHALGAQSRRQAAEAKEAATLNTAKTLEEKGMRIRGRWREISANTGNQIAHLQAIFDSCRKEVLGDSMGLFEEEWGQREQVVGGTCASLEAQLKDLNEQLEEAEEMKDRTNRLQKIVAELEEKERETELSPEEAAIILKQTKREKSTQADAPESSSFGIGTWMEPLFRARREALLPGFSPEARDLQRRLIMVADHFEHTGSEELRTIALSLKNMTRMKRSLLELYCYYARLSTHGEVEALTEIPGELSSSESLASHLFRRLDTNMSRREGPPLIPALEGEDEEVEEGWDEQLRTILLDQRGAKALLVDLGVHPGAVAQMEFIFERYSVGIRGRHGKATGVGENRQSSAELDEEGNLLSVMAVPSTLFVPFLVDVSCLHMLVVKEVRKVQNESKGAEGREDQNKRKSKAVVSLVEEEPDTATNGERGGQGKDGEAQLERGEGQNTLPRTSAFFTPLKRTMHRAANLPSRADIFRWFCNSYVVPLYRALLLAQQLEPTNLERIQEEASKCEKIFGPGIYGRQ
uniref:Uncharacterized protein n=1 Tax=Chromera velia CCMP2878 TaxID=1169474 RepID=A0A0G4HNJ7_9ALVE|eukprot:Cvel_7654.t1-p1 / transcript=Cvel_7654.t1 / gene=Cvel_7654 / organism=Chromera_velia_CCMP2878 / gene_product=hypothetical protein / transcript_product=hypothetical protein / location=Cvel_scaffold405:58760-67819(+) / protein_length=1513 / sequence_SO=supercontig / SO=protein_coding / is_pseudo=false